MSVIIIANGGDAKQAIDRLVKASHQSKLTAEQVASAQNLIDQLVALAKTTK
jgi:hypothetical protein